jgi:hypothetical protein
MGIATKDVAYFACMYGCIILTEIFLKKIKEERKNGH